MKKVLKKVRSRNIKSNFKQFLSVIFIMLLATMLFSGFITNSHTLKSCVNNYFKTTNLADLWVSTNKVSVQDEEFYANNFEKYDKRLKFETIARIEMLNNSSSANIYVYKGKLSTPYIESGKKGCLIDKNIAKNQNIKAGFHDIEFIYSVAVNGTTYNLNFKERITGTMSLDEQANTYNSWTVVIDEELFLKQLKEKLTEQIADFDADNFNEIAYNQILIKTEDVADSTAKINNYYNAETTSSELTYIYDRTEIESYSLLLEEVKQSKKMIYVFPVLFLVVGILIILTTIDQLIIQEQKRIGILKACGVPNKKILKHYSSYGSMLCFIGAIVGAILGVAIIPEIMFSRYAKIYSIPEDFIKLKVPLAWLGILILAITILGYVVAMIRSYSIVNKNPVDCLKFNAINSTKKIKKSKIKFKKMPIYIKVAFRNIRLKPLRTIMGAFGMAGCVALLLAGFGVSDTLSKSLKNDLGNVFNYDISSTYNNDSFIEQISASDKISYYEKYSKTYAGFLVNENSTDIYVFQIAENSQIFKEKLSSSDVFVSKVIAEKFGLKVGDKFFVNVKDKSIELVISGLIETSFNNGVFVCQDLGFEQSFVSKGVWIKTSAKTSDVTAYLNQINGTNTALTISEEQANVKTRIMSTSTMTKTIKVFGVLLAVIVLLNFVLLILKEKATEIATLKVLGQNSWQTSLSIFIEVFIMSGIGMILGMILGYPLMLLILKVNQVEILNYIICIKFWSYFKTFFIILFTIFSILILCYFKIKKINMAESLKSVE